MNQPDSQEMKADLRKRKSNLGETIEARLLAYAVGAGAAGVGLLALAQPARAEIVFTPTNETLTNGMLAFGFGNSTDFVLTDRFYVITGSWSTQLLNVTGRGAAAVVGHGGAASALQRGAVIGPADHFQAGKALMAGAFRETQISSTVVFGPFANTAHRFLGLKFEFNGQVHYGWARFQSVKASASNGPSVKAVWTGYAFETVADLPIMAGQMKDGALESLDPQATTLRPATLGLLALGSSGLDVWRRKETLEAGN